SWRVIGFDIAAPSIVHENFVAVRVDLCDGAAAEAAAARVERVGALIHAAGVLRVGPLGNLQASDGELMWRLHVESIARIALVMFLLSPAAGAITGQDIQICGGASLPR